MSIPSGFCPRPTDKWSNIKKKVGVFEAYRLYYKWGYELPDLAFSSDKEVWDTVKGWGEISTYSNNGGTKRLYIKYGDNETYQTNREVVRQKVDHINRAYDNLLIIDSEPIPQTENTVTGKYATGRKTAEFVDINPEALKEHYSIYEARVQELQEGQNYEEPSFSPLNIGLGDSVTKEDFTGNDVFRNIFDNKIEDTTSNKVINKLFGYGYVKKDSAIGDLLQTLGKINVDIKFKTLKNNWWL